MPVDNKDIKGQEQSAFVDDVNIYNKKTVAVPRPELQMGVDTTQSFYQNIIRQGESNAIDMTAFESFFRAARGRDEIYSLLDVMSEDSTIAAILETYAEDATEYSESGHIMWAESGEADVAKYINFLLESLNVDKNAYKWIHALAKYGDIYLRLYRESDFEDADIFNGPEKNKRQALKEDIKIHAYRDDDHYAPYVSMEPNPAEVFELTRFDKSYAYIKADITSLAQQHKTGSTITPFYHYEFKQHDVDIYQPTTFVHACLEDSSSRVPEEVTIFKETSTGDDNSKGETKEYTYRVKRGQSLLYPTFKIWRELALLENVILLNRVTKSSVVRVINVEVGDMPKEMVAPHLQGIKSLFEQKANIDTGKSFGEYTNPGPVENNVYVPTRGGVGTLSTQQVGGDVDVGKLSDLDYFQDKFFGAMRVPKQYFGITDDNAGFSGGESLSLISSRYAKMVKRLQNTLIQAITDLINLYLIDKGLKDYIHKFKIKMTPPITKEEEARREAANNSVRLTSDIMTLFTQEIDDPVLKLKALKELLAAATPDTNITALIQDAIDEIENDQESPKLPENSTENSEEDVEISGDLNLDISDEDNIDNLTGLGGETSTETEAPEESDLVLPNPSDLGDIDFTNNNSPEFNI